MSCTFLQWSAGSRKARTCLWSILPLVCSGNINEGFGRLFFVCWYLLFVVVDDWLRQLL